MKREILFFNARHFYKNFLLCSVFFTIPLIATPSDARFSNNYGITNERALELYNQGQFTAAAEIAAQGKSADNYAFAARSIITDISLSRPSKARQDKINLAQNYINSSLKIDKNNRQALLMDASLLLIRARKAGSVLAFSMGYPQNAKKKLDLILRLYPNYGEALALRGAWHLETIRLGGSTGTMMGADEASGIKEFEAALKIENNDIIIMFIYANTLILLNKNKYKARYSAILDKCIDADAAGRNEKIVVQRAHQLKTLVDNNKLDGAYQLAHSWL